MRVGRQKYTGKEEKCLCRVKFGKKVPFLSAVSSPMEEWAGFECHGRMQRELKVIPSALLHWQSRIFWALLHQLLSTRNCWDTPDVPNHKPIFSSSMVKPTGVKIPLLVAATELFVLVFNFQATLNLLAILLLSLLSFQRGDKGSLCTCPEQIISADSRGCSCRGDCEALYELRELQCGMPSCQSKSQHQQNHPSSVPP